MGQEISRQKAGKSRKRKKWKEIWKKVLTKGAWFVIIAKLSDESG